MQNFLIIVILNLLSNTKFVYCINTLIFQLLLRPYQTVGLTPLLYKNSHTRVIVNF